MEHGDEPRLDGNADLEDEIRRKWPKCTHQLINAHCLWGSGASTCRAQAWEGQGKKKKFPFVCFDFRRDKPTGKKKEGKKLRPQSQFAIAQPSAQVASSRAKK